MCVCVLWKSPVPVLLYLYYHWIYRYLWHTLVRLPVVGKHLHGFVNAFKPKALKAKALKAKASMAKAAPSDLPAAAAAPDPATATAAANKSYNKAAATADKAAAAADKAAAAFLRNVSTPAGPTHDQRKATIDRYLLRQQRRAGGA